MPVATPLPVAQMDAEAKDEEEEDAQAAVGLEEAAATGDWARVVWLSLDPRRGELQPYPPTVARRLEARHHRGHGGSVPLAGVDGMPEGAFVDFDGDGIPKQRTSKGARDVRRVEVPPGEKQARVDVVHDGRAWHMADFQAEGITEARFVALTGSEPPVAAGDAGAAAACSCGGLATSLVPVAAGEGGLAPIWEWCLAAGRGVAEARADDTWGCYSKEQNAQIEAAFQIGQASVTVEVGIRTYEIEFDDERRGFARQCDIGLKKRRHVRRRLVDAREHDALYQASSTAADTELVDEVCAICCDSFVDTPTMPVVKLPGCGHSFHGACVREVADERQKCPLCRSKADWLAAF